MLNNIYLDLIHQGEEKYNKGFYAAKIMRHDLLLQYKAKKYSLKRVIFMNFVL